ncbi:unnamed protein product (macronuclear) [Paramecium tetraurelia]|uniref:Uncharacterized protein n=1 Tax=Paramecium tetraurelia TaxID=5888 RepID=A0BIF9_PARTE|nr:uncharacterized protein GSPATT00004698001 [Paramecium tetraurelia]CAK58326.1 unnamed protein product [Paramecium tetraurelia]|eukprot:XP_001425724.1 hypothetical protein (macronuclear) [Paramecium tetraurelia strain d4-2]
MYQSQEILSDEEDFETQQYLIRQRQIAELQQQYQSKRQELDKYLKTEESIISPRIFNYETNYSTNQTLKCQISPEMNQISDIAQKQQNQYLTSFSSLNKKSQITPTSERRYEAQMNSNFNTNKTSKSPIQNPILQHNKKIIIKRVNHETQTQLTVSCKIPTNSKFTIQLQQTMDPNLNKATQTTQILKQKNLTQNTKPKAQEIPSINKYTQRFKTEYNCTKEQTESSKIQQNGRKVPMNKKQFDQWYKSQQSWVNKTEMKVFQQRMEKEQMNQDIDLQQQSFSPKILKHSQDIVNQKFSGCQFMERQQQYDNYLKMKQQNREHEEILERQSQKFRMSPISKLIVRSVTPKSYRDYSKNHTANTSWFGNHNTQCYQ